MIIDIGDKCVECKNDTSPGSGRFVNRLPAGNDEFEGYLCTECRLMTCEICNEEAIDYGGYNGMIVCDDCYPDAFPESVVEEEEIWSDERLDALHQVNIADTKKKDEEKHED